MEEMLYEVPFREWMDERPFIKWAETASPESRILYETVLKFSDLFEDMTFSYGTPTYEFIKCQSKSSGSDEWVDDAVQLPDSIKCFSYTYFTYHMADLNGYGGKFDMQDRSLTVDLSNYGNDPVLLHEMIHLHEFVINDLPMIYHDAVFYCLYKDLASKIPNLNKRIEAHGHILNSSQIARLGGVHDILFLLKGFDLDLKMGYKLGTIFGYGMVDEWDGSQGAKT